MMEIVIFYYLEKYPYIMLVDNSNIKILIDISFIRVLVDIDFAKILVYINFAKSISRYWSYKRYW